MKVLISLVAVVASSFAIARPERNAFINRPANTIPSLLNHIRTDRVVLDRYMRHFSMSKAEVLDFVGCLRLGKIKKGAYFTIYSVPENGVMRSHRSFFKTGTPAFVNAKNEPILRVKCGNPFVAGPAKVVASAATSLPKGESFALQEMPGIDDPLVSQRSDNSPLYGNVPTTEEIVEIENELPITTTLPPTINAPSNPVRTNPASVRDPRLSDFGKLGQLNLGSLLALGSLGLGVPLANSNTGTTNFVDPVPEPASLFLVSIAVAGLVMKRKKKHAA